MVDFHTHILPKVDDGSGSLRESLTMLRKSFLQGVDVVVLTPHFYGDEMYPREFLRRRNAAYKILQHAMLMSTEVYPKTALGAEVLYFPGISDAEEIASLTIGKSKAILVEPPMSPWSEDMLDDIAALGENFPCIPVIAHVDRYMQYLQDAKLIERLRERNLLVQVNAEYFLNPQTTKAAVKNLKNGYIQLIGSDCHNLDSRPPNLGLLKKQVKSLGIEQEFRMLHHNAVNLLLRRGEYA